MAFVCMLFDIQTSDMHEYMGNVQLQLVIGSILPKIYINGHEKSVMLHKANTY